MQNFSQRFEVSDSAPAQQISRAENQVLGVLHSEAKALSIREIASAMKRSPQGVYAALKKLMGKGLVCKFQATEIGKAA